MEYQRFGNKIIARMDKGEEITEQLRRIAEQEQIRLATVSALGAIDPFTVGAFITKDKSYISKEWTGDHEIVSLTGTISTMDGAYYAHLHMSAGNSEGLVVGGHLNSATVSATCEMVIDLVDGQVDRKFNDEVGLNLLTFD